MRQHTPETTCPILPYFMSTVCGRPQGGEGVRPMWTGGRGSKTWIFCGRHKWMAPYLKWRGNTIQCGHVNLLFWLNENLLMNITLV